jgi:transcriptional regulator with XRE-family HTH domain
MAAVDLPSLIAHRRRQTGDDLRTMAERARSAGHPISRSMISTYMRGEAATPPNRERVQSLAAALGVSFDEVAAAVNESYRLDGEESSPRDVEVQRAQAWLRLTGERTDDEVNELLLIVEQILRMRDKDRP